jgi:hypothetical protein
MDELDAIAQTEIQPGWGVVDADDQPIGHVTEIHSASFTVETGVGGQREVAYTDIESADDGRVTLAIGGDELVAPGDA